MSGTIRGADRTGQTVYGVIVNADGERWNGTAFEAYVAGNYTNYALAMTEQGSSGIYTVSFPSTIDEGLYEIFFYEQAAASPAQGDMIVGTATFAWDGTDEVEETGVDSTTPTLIAAAQPGNTLYCQIINRQGERFYISAFESYTAAHYADYVITLTEQGATGVYTGTFPSNITDAGTYEAIFYRQSGASPASGDPIVGSAELILAVTGAMTGLQFYNYLLRTFKRTDKETEAYEALSDTIRDLRRRVIFADDETEMSTSDVINTLGTYQINMEDSWGLTIASVVLLNGASSKPLNMISKREFDRRYPYPTASDALRGVPQDVCIFNNKLLIGPVPDSLNYTYKVNFSEEDAAAIVSSTTAVPHARLYREILKMGTLMRLYRDLGFDSEYGKFKAEYETGIMAITDREERNRFAESTVQYRGI